MTLTVKEVIDAFKEFVELFDETERRRVFGSKEYVQWTIKNQWLIQAPDEEHLR